MEKSKRLLDSGKEMSIGHTIGRLGFGSTYLTKVQVRQPMEVTQASIDVCHKDCCKALLIKDEQTSNDVYYNILQELHNQGRISESQMWDYQEAKGLPIK